MNFRISFSCLLILCASYLSSQCDLSNIQTISSNCSDNSFQLEINFESNDTLSDSFNINYNGILYGLFSYQDLPVIVDNIPSNCSSSDSLTIIDFEDPTCFVSSIVNNNCCLNACNLEIEYLVNIECNGIDGNIAELDLVTPESPSQNFHVYQDGNSIGSFLYADLPIELALDNNEFTSEIVVCDEQVIDCCDTLVHASSCSCAIYDIDYSMSTCNDSSFMLSIDFEYFMVSDSFEIGGNGMSYGSHAYSDLPITIGPLFFDSLDYEVVIFEQINAFCFNFLDLGVVESCMNECSLGQLIANPTECDETGQFNIQFDFNQINVLGSEFAVFVNDELVDTLAYQDTSYVVGPFDGDCNTQYEIFLRDLFNPECNSNLGLIGTICCPQDSSCQITNLDLSVSECSDDNSFDVHYSFDFVNNASDHFLFLVNNIIRDTLEYGEAEYVAGPFDGDCTTLYSFAIQDLTDSLCIESFILQDPVCCDSIEMCMISDLSYNLTECTEDQTFWLEFEFEINTTESSYFYFFQDSVLIDSFAYDIMEYSVGSFPGDCQTQYNFSLVDGLDSQCSFDFSLPEVICCETTDTCFINQFIVSETDCEEQQFFIEFNFESDQTSADSFTLNLNQLVIDSFAYGQDVYTAGPFLGDCQTTYRFQMVDLEGPQCFSNLALVGPICCEIDSACFLSNLEFELSDCDTLNTFDLSFDFDNSTNSSENYLVYIDSSLVDTMSYNDLPANISNLDGLCDSAYDFFIQDAIDSTCFLSFSVPAPICCVMDTCNLGMMNIIDFSCFQDLVNIEYDFAFNETSDSFNIFSADSLISTEAYTIGTQLLSLNSSELSDSFLIKICDQAKPNCCTETVLALEDCLDNCGIDSLSFDFLECDSNMFYIQLEAEFTFVDTLILDVFSDSIYYGQFSNIEFPLEIGPFLSDSVNYHIQLLELNELCSYDLLFDGNQCIDTNTQDQESSDIIYNYSGNLIWLNESITYNEIRLYDTNGMKLLSTKDRIINVEMIPTGVYILSIINESNIQSFKIFVY